MRGSIKQRSKGSWSLVLDLGRDPVSGRRRQKRVTLQGTKRQAEDHLRELTRSVRRGEYVEPSDTTVGQWLDTWFAIAKTTVRPSTVVRYQNVIETIQASPLGARGLQTVRASDLETHYAQMKASASTIGLHHTVLRRALKKAKRDNLILANPALDVETRPRRSRDPEQARENCWTKEEARQFLAAVKTVDSQSAALYTLALDSGARKSELCGLAWSHVDLHRCGDPDRAATHQTRSRADLRSTEEWSIADGDDHTRDGDSLTRTSTITA
jgi:integrase